MKATLLKVTLFALVSTAIGSLVPAAAAKQPAVPLFAAGAFGFHPLDWTGGQRVAADDATPLDYFGSAVAISGDTAVVGANAATVGDNTFQGAVYVFTRSGGVWTQAAKLVADDGAAGDLFGSAVAIDGTTLLVGATSAAIDGNTFQGAAYVFSGSGANWSQVTKLTASDGGADSYFGVAVALAGGRALVGATNGAVANYQGSVYAFADDNGTWGETQTLVPDDSAPFDRFGMSIALDGANAIIGAAGAEVDGATFRGAAYVFTLAGASWSQQQKLVADDGVSNDGFGWSVALLGDTALVGAPGVVIDGRAFQGAAYVFTASGTVWTGSAKLVAVEGAENDALGWSVALDQGTALAGAFGATVHGNFVQGLTYAFAGSGASWSETQQLAAGDGVANDGFGTAVAAQAGTLLIGAPHATDDGTASSGSAYFFEPTVSDAIFSDGFDPAAGIR